MNRQAYYNFFRSAADLAARCTIRTAALLGFGKKPEGPAHDDANPHPLKQYFLDLSLGSKFALAYIVTLLTFLLSSYLIFYPLIRRSIEVNIESNLQNATQSILNTVRTAANVSIRNYLRAMAEKNRDIVAGIYERYRRGELTQAQAKDLAAKILLSQHVGKTGYMYVMDSKSVIQVHPVPSILHTSVAYHPLAHEQTERKEGYIEYQWQNPGEKSPREKAVYITYFEPWDWIISASSYRSEFGDLIDISTFRDSILSMRLGKTGYSYIINSRGDVIMHPSVRGNQYNAKTEDGQEFVKEMCDRKDGRIIYSWRNPGETGFHKKLAVYNCIPEYDWIVVSTSYEKEFYEPLRQMRNMFWSIVIMLLAIVLALSRTFSSYIMTHMGRLLDAFQNVGLNGFSFRLKQLSKDEFGRLTAGFNDFMSKLDAYNNSLRSVMAQRLKAEEELLGANANYKSLLRAATGFAVIATDTKGLIKVFNTGAERMLGYSADEVVDKATYEMLHEPKELAARAAELGDLTNSDPLAARSGRDGLEVREWLFIRKDGTRFPVLLSVTPQRDIDGALIGYLGIAEDITERKRAEAELLEQTRRADALRIEAEAANKAKSAFLANMSHELRTPLNVMLGSADVLLNEMLGLLNSKQKEYLANMKHSSAHLLALINDILNLAKIESGKMELNLKESSLPETARYAMAFIGEMAVKAGVTLKFTQGYEQDLSMSVDELKIKQILYNLLSNAIKFTPSGGTVSLSLRLATMDELRLENPRKAEALHARNPETTSYASINISDSGIGIKPEDMDKLFKPFTQVETSNTRNYEGSGLGLIISKRLAELHKGSIWMKSEFGSGSTFTLLLPYRNDAA
ncbi:MAG: PAS domain S-box protein [Elusimicrobia bacterium]|nr:PAS domain S-box protein [Elusimicrobiota bacterium]